MPIFLLKPPFSLVSSFNIKHYQPQSLKPDTWGSLLRDRLRIWTWKPDQWLQMLALPHIVPRWPTASSFLDFKFVDSHHGSAYLPRSLRGLNYRIKPSVRRVIALSKSLPIISFHCYNDLFSPSPCHPISKSVDSTFSLCLKSILSVPIATFLIQPLVLYCLMTAEVS